MRIKWRPDNRPYGQRSLTILVAVLGATGTKPRSVARPGVRIDGAAIVRLDHRFEHVMMMNEVVRQRPPPAQATCERKKQQARRRRSQGRGRRPMPGCAACGGRRARRRRWQSVVRQSQANGGARWVAEMRRRGQRVRSRSAEMVNWSGSFTVVARRRQGRWRDLAMAGAQPGWSFRSDSASPRLLADSAGMACAAIHWRL